jgi:hypothetical protein
MAKITSIAGRFSGTLSFSDGNVGGFHVQMEADDDRQLYWTINEVFTRLGFMEADRDARAGRAGIYNLAFSGCFESLMTNLSVNWGIDWSGSAKDITDAVYSLSLIVTTDDPMEFPVSVTFEKGQVIRHTPLANTASNYTNYAIITSRIEAMMTQIPTMNFVIS